MKGVYKQVADIIRQKQNISPVIDAQNIKRQMDVSDLDLDEIVEEWKTFVVAISMADVGLRASIRGTGLYVDIQNLRDPKVLELIMDNIDGDIKNKQKIEERILTLIREGGSDIIPGQGVYIPVGTELNLSQESSDEEIVEALRSIAV